MINCIPTFWLSANWLLVQSLNCANFFFSLFVFFFLFPSILYTITHKHCFCDTYFIICFLFFFLSFFFFVRSPTRFFQRARELEIKKKRRDGKVILAFAFSLFCSFSSHPDRQTDWNSDRHTVGSQSIISWRYLSAAAAAAEVGDDLFG